MNDKEQIKKKTLKDLDFLKHEKEIFIEEEKKKRLLTVFEKDSKFLKGISVIDYSVLLMKINRSEYLKSLNFERVNAEINFIEKLNNDLWIIESTQEKGIYYYFGIIDYLQEFNTRKNLEVIGKKMMKLNPYLDISVQDPEKYSKRFIEYFKKILFGEFNKNN